MRITIRDTTGRCMTVSIQPHNSILRVKKSIQKINGIPPSQQDLAFRGEKLREDRKTLADCGATDGAILDVIYVEMEDDVFYMPGQWTNETEELQKSLANEERNGQVEQAVRSFATAWSNTVCAWVAERGSSR